MRPFAGPGKMRKAGRRLGCWDIDNPFRLSQWYEEREPSLHEAMNGNAVNKPLRIIALGDSLALPREIAADTVLWEETWPYLLEKELRASGIDAEVINCSRRERTADTLVTEFREHIRFKHPDVAVLQIGLVDGAPRVFIPRERKWLGVVAQIRFTGPFRRWIIGRRSARRAKITAKNPLAKVRTRPEAFATHPRTFHRRALELPWPLGIFVLPMMANEEAMERKSPGYRGNATLYNNLLREFCRETGATFIEPREVQPTEGAGELFCSDGHHLNPLGGAVVARAVCKAIMSMHSEANLVRTD